MGENGAVVNIYFIFIFGANMKRRGLFFKGSVISCVCPTLGHPQYAQMPSLIKFFSYLNT